jgi:MOSC domain-containing protein YiiM
MAAKSGSNGDKAAGRIVAIGIARADGGTVESLAAAEVVAGVGIPGDRYAEGRGTFHDFPDRELTLVEAEAAVDAGVADPLLLRRNVVTRGIRLNDLIGRRFRLGEALLEGVRPCHPCSYLEGLLAPGLKEHLQGRGGLRARVLEGGRIAIGDLVGPDRGEAPRPKDN